MDKKALLTAIIEEMKREFSTLVDSALEAKDAATNEESKAENKYDTRGLEASYLAGAQAKRAQELKTQLNQLQNLNPISYKEGEPIGPSALVQVTIDDAESKWMFLLPQKGGVTVESSSGEMVTTISMNSPLGKNLINKSTGDDFEITIAGKLKFYEINEVQ